MRIGGRMAWTGLLLVLLPCIAQLIFIAIIGGALDHGATNGLDPMQRKLLIGAGSFFVLLSATLYFVFHDAVVEEIRRLADNVQRISEGRKDRLEELRTSEFKTVQQHYQDLEKALKLAVVAAHEGKESRVAELKLRLHEERVRLIVDSIPVGLAVVDLRGNIESVNPALEAIFASTQSQLIGSPFRDLFVDAKLNAAEMVESLARLAPTKPTELSAQRGNAEVFSVEVTVQRFETVEGNRFLALLLDVTERHEIERLKQEFVAMVSHELRTPLSSISAFLEMLSLGTFDDDISAMKNRSETANRNVTRMVGLVNNLLDLEKMQAGRFEFNFRRITANTVIQRAMESVREFAEQHKVIFSSEEVCNAAFDGDEERLLQVLINLLSNAIKFSTPGETVKISAYDAGDWLEMSVEDSGPGVPAGSESLIFEKYRQALQPEANVRTKGTGLGLPLCKAIVEQHGGSIGVDSNRKKGSRFWFRIPKCATASMISGVVDNR